MGRRIGVADEEWSVIAKLLPAEQGRNYHPGHDNRKYFEGMLWIAKTGAQWRQLPAEYGKWNSVYKCFRRWAVTGVWDKLLEALSGLAEREGARRETDSNVILARKDTSDVVERIRTRRLWADRNPAVHERVQDSAPTHDCPTS